MTELPALVEFAVNSGFTAIIFLIWYLSFKNANASHERLTTQFTQSTEELSHKAQKAYEDALKINQEQNERLIAVVKEGHELHVHLVRNLQRLEDKLNQPVRCPYQVSEQRAHQREGS